MTHNSIQARQPLAAHLLVGCGLACVVLLPWLAPLFPVQTRSESETPARPSTHVTHVLGFEGAKRNAGGELRISGAALQFQQDGNVAAAVNIGSIQNISVGTQDNQVGGAPMTLGKAAVPFGGGRAVSLFAHKKYDSLTVEYLDSDGGYHGAIFRLAKGQGQTFKNELIASDAHVPLAADPATTQSTPEVKNENK